MTVNKVEISRHNAEQTREMAGELAALFVGVFDTPDRHDDPFFKEEKYLERLHAYTGRSGYDLVAARIDGNLIGYMSGFCLAADTAWWQGLEPRLPAEDASEMELERSRSMSWLSGRTTESGALEGG